MPIYEYECEDCKQIFEEWQQGFDDLELSCPVCGGASRRVISNTSFVLKGSGWYVTDYAGKTPSPSAADGNGGEGNGNGAGNGNGTKPAEAASAKREEAKAAACPGKAPTPGPTSTDTSA